ncbi:kinase-like domain-containing protein, partial [Lenzites betulinus]
MVLLVEHNATGQLYALKVIKKNSLSTEDLRTVFVEQDVMKTLNGNPFFTSLKGSFEDADNFFLLMDWHIGGDLDARIKEEGRLSTDEARSYAAQIIIGMEELHRQRIIHRDIKPKNILLNAQHEVIITDFGLSRMFGRTVDEQPALVVDKTDSTCGTATHMSPELFVNMGYSYSLDHWAFAVTLYEMLYGKLPFIPENAASFEEFVIRVRHEAVKVDDKAVDRDANDLLQMMLDKDLHRRPTWAQIKKHKWFNLIDWDRLAHRKPHLAPYAPKNLKTERHARGIAFGKPCEAEYPWLEWAAPEFKATTTASISTKVSKKFLTPASTTSRHASDNDLVHTASTASRQAPAPLAKHTPSSSAGVAHDSGASYCTVSLTSQSCSRKGSFTAYA